MVINDDTCTGVWQQTKICAYSSVGSSGRDSEQLLRKQIREFLQKQCRPISPAIEGGRKQQQGIHIWSICHCIPVIFNQTFSWKKRTDLFDNVMDALKISGCCSSEFLLGNASIVLNGWSSKGGRYSLPFLQQIDNKNCCPVFTKNPQSIAKASHQELASNHHVSVWNN